jgi:hypothetical protein
MVFVSVKTDYDTFLRYASQTKEKDIVRQKKQAISHAFKVLEAWCVNHGGTIFKEDYSDSIFEVPVAGLTDLEKVVRQFAEHSDLDTFAGVGNSIEECRTAADVAKKRNLDHPVLMTEQLNESLESSFSENNMSKSLNLLVPKPQSPKSKPKHIDIPWDTIMADAIEGRGEGKK